LKLLRKVKDRRMFLASQNIVLFYPKVLALDKILKMKKKNTTTTARSTRPPSPGREGAGGRVIKNQSYNKKQEAALVDILLELDYRLDDPVPNSILIYS